MTQPTPAILMPDWRFVVVNPHRQGGWSEYSSHPVAYVDTTHRVWIAPQPGSTGGRVLRPTSAVEDFWGFLLEPGAEITRALQLFSLEKGQEVAQAQKVIRAYFDQPEDPDFPDADPRGFTTVQDLEHWVMEVQGGVHMIAFNHQVDVWREDGTLEFDMVDDVAHVRLARAEAVR